MLNLSGLVKNWSTGPYGSRIAPAGVGFIAEGIYITVGDGVSLGDGATVGSGSVSPLDLGHADGYRKVISGRNGFAWVTAGCRSFCLADALEHWGAHKEDRSTTMCLMQAAKAYADKMGWRYR